MADTAGYRPQRPRTSSMLSWGSHKSKESQPKMDMTETEKDKAQRRIKGKADPSVAINELQPSDQAQQKNTMSPLRSMQFKDSKGDIITDPDRSNPTRPRMERPLDTIRSFEAAVNSGYTNRRHSVALGNNSSASFRSKSYFQSGVDEERYNVPRQHMTRQGHGCRPIVSRYDFAFESSQASLASSPSRLSLIAKASESSATPSNCVSGDQSDPSALHATDRSLTYMASEDTQSRRSSFYQGHNAQQPRMPGAYFNQNAYAERQPDSRPESMVYDQQPVGAYGAYPGSPGNGNHQPRRTPHNRMNSEPLYSSQGRQQIQQQGYDAATASSSGTYQTEQGTHSTDPSSYSGSTGEVNRTAQYTKPQPSVPQETYGIEFANRQEDEYGMPLNKRNRPPQQNHTANGAHGDMAPPPPPPHGTGARNGLRKPAPNGNGTNGVNGGYGQQPYVERPKTEKRKSWLARRFSKSG